MKELSVEEVLRIAGGVPVSGVLDELSYRAPQESAGEPVDWGEAEAIPYLLALIERRPIRGALARVPAHGAPIVLTPAGPPSNM